LILEFENNLSKKQRYVLLLEQILKSTPNSHPDRQDLEASITELKKMAAEIDKRKGESMKLQSLMELQQKFVNYPAQKWGDFGTPGRELVLEGDLMERLPSSVLRERRVFLFTDLLVCTRPAPQQGFFKTNSFV